MGNFKGFTNLQPESKTIKFRLDPVGDTMKNIEKGNILKIAEEKEKKRQELKVYIDEFHKKYIDKKLEDTTALVDKVFSTDKMQELLEVFNGKNKEEKEGLFDKFGKKLSDYMQDSDEYKKLDKKEFITVILPEYLKDDKDALEVISFWKKSVTEVADLTRKRKRLYDNENNFGTIVNRTIWVNLQKYLTNIAAFNAFVKMYQNDEIQNNKAKQAIRDLEDKLDVRIIPSCFSIDNYSFFCSQHGIDVYNTIIGGFTREDGTKVQGLNEIINIHNSKTTESDKKLSKFDRLFKQLMSDSVTYSFVEDQIKSDKELYEKIDKAASHVDGCIDEIEAFLKSINSNEIDKIYVEKTAHGDISNAIFKHYYVINDAIREEYNETHPAKNKETKKYVSDRKRFLDNVPCYSIAYLNNLVNADIADYFREEIQDMATEYRICSRNYKKLDKHGRPFRQNKNAKIVVKALMDSILSVRRLLRNLAPSDIPVVKDNIFYNSLFEYINNLSDEVSIFNKARNYATKKDFDSKEMEVSVVSGWTNPDVAQSVILSKGNSYYLAIIDDSARKCLNKEVIKAGKDNYSYMDYNLVADAAKSCPHMFFSGKYMTEHPEMVKRHQAAVDAYSNRKNNGTGYTAKDEENIIRYYQEGLIDKYRGTFNFSFKKPSEYESLRAFLKDVDDQSYCIKKREVDSEYIDSLVREGKIYLFRVSSRDFADNPKTTPTLFSLYWKILFDQRNLDNPVHRLSGGARVTYREKSITNPYIHKAGTPIALKKSKDGKTKTYTYDIIKNRRYTYDSFFLSVTIEANFKGDPYARFNTLANQYIRSNKDDMHIIGITRGIKNLIYYTVIDMKGNVVEHNSLNIIKNKMKDGSVIEDDYNANLEIRARENVGKKLSWDSEYTIKDLKEGYMSQVVSVISKLMIKYNAAVVLEDLSGNFKDKQKAIEKTVYTDFENALLKKLHFLITDKDINSNAEGSVLKPYQLCATVNNKESLSFQNGFVFFLSPAYTGSLDPSTGFINRLNLQYKGKENAESILKTLDYMKFEDDCYKIAFDYKNFKYIDKKDFDGIKTDWIINTRGIRYNIYRNKSTNNMWKGETVDLTDAFTQLFAEYDIDVQGDILTQIIDTNKAKLYESFLNLLRLVVRTNNNLENDYVYASPVEGSAYNEHYGIADNISSYNIARKGLMAVEKITGSKDDFVKIASTTNDWLRYNLQNPHKA